jgi:hypothetical protein
LPPPSPTPPVPSAFGNLDGDAEFATFTRVASVVAMEIKGGAGLYIDKEIE